MRLSSLNHPLMIEEKVLEKLAEKQTSLKNYAFKMNQTSNENIRISATG